MFPYLFLSFGFLQEVFHCIHCLLETFAFVDLDHLFFVGVVGLQLFNFDPCTVKIKKTQNVWNWQKLSKSIFRYEKNNWEKGSPPPPSSHLLVFCSEEFHKVALLSSGLLQILGRAHYLMCANTILTSLINT